MFEYLFIVYAVMTLKKIRRRRWKQNACNYECIYIDRALCDHFSQMLTNVSSHCVLLASHFCRNSLELRVFEGSVQLMEFLCGEGRDSKYINARAEFIAKCYRHNRSNKNSRTQNCGYCRLQHMVIMSTCCTTK